MGRVWKQVLSPKQMNKVFDVYHGEWMPHMDRCWNSDDHLQVLSRLIRTDWGTVEHVTIKRYGEPVEFELSGDGSKDIPWKIKQEVKNELFGEDRVAIEVFPSEKNLVDICDVYHLWVLPKGFKIPFGIHPRDKKTHNVNRGALPLTQELLDNTKETTK